MQWLDWVVLGGYFVAMGLIGWVCSLRIKGQEDYFMGGRGFGRLLQTFAAFGAGTGSQEPITVGRTTWTSGLTGIWGVLMWLFVTPFYWVFGVWYRRMRCITIGDFFVERYESKGLGAAYALFGLYFYMFYLSTMYTALLKVAAAILQTDVVTLPGVGEPIALAYVLVPAIAGFVLLYGLLGGLKAAYWTDLIQGIGIIALSILLIPFGLDALIERFDPESGAGLMRGFEIMHERLPESYFAIVGGPRAGEFPLHYIVSLSLLGLLGIVVQPHFIATGGGSAKTETSARIGLVTGNFLKRFCTVGWAITGLIVLALLADSSEVMLDADKSWGVATRELLPAGLVGLMLACLMAALMSSADTYMIMSGGLVTRNLFAVVVPDASERTYLMVGRLAGLVMVVGAVVISLVYQDVFTQFVDAITTCLIFAAVFWVGMWWRRGTKWAAWGTVLFTAGVFFVLPMMTKVVPGAVPSYLRGASLAIHNDIVTTRVVREATAVDVGRRAAFESAVADAEAAGDEAMLARLGGGPPVVEVGEEIEEVFVTGGKPIFWSSLGVAEGGGAGGIELVSEERDEAGQGGHAVLVERRTGDFVGSGTFKPDMLVYHWLGVDLRRFSDTTLKTMELPPKFLMPFLVMIVLSWLTPRNSEAGLDRFYSKMKTPVLGDAEEDAGRVEAAAEDAAALRLERNIWPGSNLEIQKPTWADVIGFVACVGVCFVIVWLIVWLASIGG